MKPWRGRRPEQGDPSVAADVLRESITDLSTTALVAGVDGFDCPPGDPCTPVGLPIERDRPEHLRVVTDLPHRTIVSIAQQYSPGWHAELDGEPIDVVEVDGLFLGVDVPAGRHAIDLEYRPGWLTPTLIVSVLAVLAHGRIGDCRGAATPRRHSITSRARPGSSDMTVLVTGGAGYIGSHTVRALREQGRDVVVLDSLELGRPEAVLGAELIVGGIHDADLVEKLCAEREVSAIVHFAAYKSVGESMQLPGKYWHNNVDGTAALVDAALQGGVRDFVFSSSCSVYGTPETVPVVETAPIQPESVYAESKATVERILRWYGVTHGLRSASLRYFNAAGASHDSVIGEDWDFSINLIPLVMKAVLGAGPPVHVFGNDYPTPDGTCIRDYIHVEDLADAHVKALDALERGEPSGRWPSTSARASGHRCSMSSRPPRPSPGDRCPTRSPPAGPVTPSPRSPIRRTPRRCSGGDRARVSTRSSRRPTAGTPRPPACRPDRLGALSPMIENVRAQTAVWDAARPDGRGRDGFRPVGRGGRGRASRGGWRSPGDRGAGGARRRPAR